MHKWKVITPTGEKDVNAGSAAVSTTGDLVLCGPQGDVVRVFASGAWLECEMVKQGSHGYGG